MRLFYICILPLYSLVSLYLNTVFIPLRPAGFIQDCKHFAAGFIGILLHTDAGSIRGRVLLEGGLNWNKYGRLLSRTVNFYLFLKLAPLLVTALHVISSCADMQCCF